MVNKIVLYLDCTFSTRSLSRNFSCDARSLEHIIMLKRNISSSTRRAQNIHKRAKKYYFCTITIAAWLAIYISLLSQLLVFFFGSFLSFLLCDCFLFPLSTLTLRSERGGKARKFGFSTSFRIHVITVGVKWDSEKWTFALWNCVEICDSRRCCCCCCSCRNQQSSSAPTWINFNTFLSLSHLELSVLTDLIALASRYTSGTARRWTSTFMFHFNCHHQLRERTSVVLLFSIFRTRE